MLYITAFQIVLNEMGQFNNIRLKKNLFSSLFLTPDFPGVSTPQMKVLILMYYYTAY